MFTTNYKSASMRIFVILGLLFGIFAAAPVRASSLTIYVNTNAMGANDGSSWSNAYTDLQSALAAATSGDEIWVAAGTYKPTPGTERTISFSLQNGIAMYGGFDGTEALLSQRNAELHVTILSGDIGDPFENYDNSYHVVSAENVDNTAILDGFTIQDGNANDLASVYGGRGGGMFNYYSSPTLSNLIFTGNTAGDFGGGMSNSHSNPVITDSVFINNNADFYGGGMYNEGESSPTLTNVDFYTNVAHYGGGMYIFGSSTPTLVDVIFANNMANGDGGGISNVSGSNPTLTRVTFRGNTATFSGNTPKGGGMYNSNSNATLTDVVFVGNFAALGGGIYNSNSNLTLTNLNFSENTVGYSGGGMYNNNSNPMLTNVIFSGNSIDIDEGNAGGGMLNHTSNPVLSNVTFSNNRATTNGGGMANYYNSNPILSAVTFEHNVADISGGGMDNDNSNPNLSQVIFIDNSSNTYGGGLSNVGSSPILKDVIFQTNTSDYGGGMWNGFSSHPDLERVTFEGNSASAYGGGMGSEYSNPTLTNVTFTKNVIPWGGSANGASMYNGASNPILTNVTFSGNGGGIYNLGSDITIINSILWGNAGPELINEDSDYAVRYSIIEGGFPGTGNLDQDPILAALQNNGGFTTTMAIGLDSTARDTGNDEYCPATDQRGLARPQGDHCDIGAYENRPLTHFVKSNALGLNDGSSWNNAYVSLQSALTRATSGDQIWVAAGIYTPTAGTDRTSSFTLKNGVKVYGGFNGTEASLEQRDPTSNVAILSGDIGAANDINDNSFHVIVGSGTNNTAILDGFVITGGNANDTSMDNPQISGGGMYIALGSPTLSNLTFTSNSAGSGGGLATDNSSPVMQNITFIGNTAFSGGGWVSIEGSPKLRNATFSENIAEYAGGGLSNSSSSPTLENITITGNTAPLGGGIYNVVSNPVIRNITISENSASAGGAIYNGESHPTIVNSIFWGNTGGEIENIDESAPVVSSSIVQGGYTGTGNLNIDPRLGILQDNGGFTKTMALDKNSPAIDAGDDEECPDTDQRGMTRPQGDHCDIGAYEYQDLPPVVSSVIRADSNNTNAASVTFTVVFSETVTGVDAGDFILTKTGVAGISITNVSGTDTTYTVTVNSGTGNGTIRLDVVDNDTILDEFNNPLGGPGTGNGNFNAGETYTIVKTAPKPGVPSLLSPATGALLNTLQPTLDWKDSIPPAHHYQVQVSTNNTFTALTINEINISVSNFDVTSGLIPGKLYYWRAKAFNVLGSASAWSVTRTFKTPLAQPTLVSPTEAEALLTDRPSFDWNAVDGATSYILQVSAVNNFSTLLVNATVKSADYTMPKDLPQNKTLFWRVRAKSPAVIGLWSAKWTFKTGNPPSVPVLVAPANNDLVKNYIPLLNWNNSITPSGTTFKHYELELDDNADFSSSTTTLRATSDFTPGTDLASNTKFYWRVRAVNSVLNPVTNAEEEHGSAWSSVWSFRTIIPAPTSLTKAPGNPNPLRPSFEWDAATGSGTVTGYTIQISTRADFSTFLVNSTGPAPSYTLAKDLPAGKTLYLRVRVNGANGPSTWTKMQFSLP